jgi:Fusaric acid resistance protein-like
VPSRARERTLFNASGLADRLPTAGLFSIGPAAPRPALRRGALLAVPVGAALLVELGVGTSSQGAVATGALFVGLAGLDAPALPRAAWQAAVTVFVALAAALGALTGGSAALAVITMAIVGIAAGYCFSVSLRLATSGLTVALSLLVAQGLGLGPGDAPEAFAFAFLGGMMQAAFSLLVHFALRGRGEEGGSGWSTAETRRELRANLTLSSTSARHALRFGTAMAAGVGCYWLAGMEEHGYWIPLTVLFVLRPEEGETFHRLILRAVGTAVGLVLATALSYWLHDDGYALAIALTIASAFAFGLLTVQYALFTVAITTYAVLLADTLGEPALDAAAQRALGTAVGIVIAALAFLIWTNPRGAEEPEIAPPPPPEPVAR